MCQHRCIVFVRFFYLNMWNIICRSCSRTLFNPLSPSQHLCCEWNLEESKLNLECFQNILVFIWPGRNLIKASLSNSVVQSKLYPLFSSLFLLFLRSCVLTPWLTPHSVCVCVRRVDIWLLWNHLEAMYVNVNKRKLQKHNIFNPVYNYITALYIALSLFALK